MINEKDLREFRPQIRYQNGSGITLDTVQDALKDAAMNNGIPVAFKRDQVKSGGVFNSSIDDCLVMYHPEHEKDYYKFCIRVKQQGNFAFVSVNDFGTSKNEKKINMQSAAKSSVKGGWAKSNAAASSGSSNIGMHLVGGLVGGAVSGLAGLGGSKMKAEEEKTYYSCVFAIFNNIIS